MATCGHGLHRSSVLDGSPDPPRERTILRGKGGHCDVDPIATHCRQLCKTAVPIEMLFGMWTRLDPGYHVLDGVHIGDTWRIRLNCPCAAAMRSCEITLSTCSLQRAALQALTSYGNSVRLSVCPSVRPSHAGIVSTRRHVARCSSHCQIAKCV